MDADAALADLMEISSQVEAAVVVDEATGAVLGSTLPADRAERLAGIARELLAAAAEAAPGGREPTQLEAATGGGSLFVLREAGRAVTATTAASPTVGLVFYDLKTCLRALGPAEEAKPKRKPRPRRRKQEDADAPA